MRLLVCMLAAACAGTRLDPPGLPATDEPYPIDVPEPLGPVCGVAGETAWLPQDIEKVDGCGRFLGWILVPHAFDADALAPLRNLVRIDGGLAIHGNFGIEDLQDLSRLEIIGDQFSITFDEEDGRLACVDGLDALREVGELYLAYNFDLASLRGFARLEVVNGDVLIEGNRMLPQSEIDWLLGRIEVAGTTSVSR